MPTTPPSEVAVRVVPAATPEHWERGRALVSELIEWLATVVQLDARAHQHDTNEELDDLEQFYRLPAGQLLVGFVGETACGTTGVHLISPTTAELRRVWVSPTARGHGLASKLLETGLATARSLGASQVWLETVSGPMDKAIGMYTRAGFAPIANYSSLPETLPNVLSLGRQL